MEKIFIDTEGPGLPCTYKVDLEAGTIAVQKHSKNGNQYFQKIVSAPRIKRVLKRARAKEQAAAEASDELDNFNFVGSRHHY